MTATMVKKRVRAARAMVTRVVGNEEGDDNGDKRTVAATDSKRRACQAATAGSSGNGEGKSRSGSRTEYCVLS